MALPEVGVKAVVDNLSGFNRGVQQVQHGYNVLDQGADAVSKKSGGLGGALRGLGGSMLSLGATAAKVAAGGIAALGAGLAAVATTSVKTAAEFESQIAIMAVAVDSAEASIEDLSEAALMVGEDTTLVGVSATQAADAMTGLFKAGLDTTDVFGDLNSYLEGTTELSGALRAAVDLQAASSLDLAMASDAVAIAMNTFGLSAEDATRISDNFVQAADASVAEVEDLVAALENVGPTAAAFGFSLEDTNNALALLSTRGISGAEAGTALKSMLTNIQRPSKQVTEEMAKLGIELYDNQGNLKDLRDIIAEFSDALAEDATVTERVGGATEKMAKEANSARAKIPKLTTKLSEQEAQLSILQQELAATVEKYGEASVQAQKKRLAVTKLTNDIAENRTELGNYNRSIALYNDANATAATATRKLTEEERNMAVQTIAGTYGMKALQTLVAEGVDGWDAMAEATAGAASASDVAFARTDTLEGAMEALDGVIETLKIRIGNTLLPVVTDMARAFADFVNENAPQIEAAFQAIADWIGTVLPIAAQRLAALWVDVLQPALARVWQFIQADFIPAMRNMFAWMQENLPKAIAFISERWGAFQSAIDVVLGFIRENVVPVLGTVATWLQENIPKAISAVEAFFNEHLKKPLGDIANFIVQDVVGAFRDVVSWLKEKIPEAITAAKSFFDENLKQPLQAVINFISESVIPAFGAIADWLKEKIPQAISTLETFFNEHLKQPLGDAKQALVDFVEYLKVELPKAADEVRNRFEQSKQAIVDFARIVQADIPLSMAAGAGATAPMVAAIGTFQIAINDVLPLIEAFKNLFAEIGELLGVIATPFAMVIGLFVDLKGPADDATGSLEGAEKAAGLLAWVLDHLSSSISALTDLIRIVTFILDNFTNMLQEKVINAISGWITAWEGLNRIIEIVGSKINEFLAGAATAIADIGGAIDGLLDKLGGLLDAFMSLNLPDWMTPGSPTPLETSLVGLTSTTAQVTRAFEGLGQVLGSLLGTNVLQQSESMTDSLDGLFGVANRIASLGSAFAQVFQRQEIDPVSESIKTLEDRLKALAAERKALEEGGAPSVAFAALDAEEVRLTGDLNAQLEKRAELEERVLRIQERQQQLAFLQQQLDLVKLIQQYGLEPVEVLGDIELGLGADPGALMDAMSGALENIITRINEAVTGGPLDQIVENIPERTQDVWAFGDSLEGVTTAAEGAATAMSSFMGELGDFAMPEELEPGSESIFERVLGAIANLLSEVLVKALEAFGTEFDAAVEAWKTKLDSFVGIITDLYQNKLPILQSTVTSTSASIVASLQTVIGTLIGLAEGTLPSVMAAFQATFTGEGGATDVIGQADEAVDDMILTIDDLIATLVDDGGLADALFSLAEAGGPLEAVGGAFQDAFGGEGGATTLVEAAQTAVNDLGTVLGGLPTTLSGVKGAFQSTFTGVGGAVSVINAAAGAIGSLISALTGADGLTDTLEIVRAAWYDAWISAIESIMAAVEAINEALETTILLLGEVRDLAEESGAALGSYFGGGGALMAPAMTPATVAAPVSTNNVFNFGGNTINSGVDAMMLESRVRSIVATAIRTGR